MPLKTIFLNPPSFENFDGGASSRWPATREIESYWYPVWLTYPAGMLEGSRVLDAPPHHVSADETIKICKDFDFLVLFTSTVGWEGDQRLAEAIKAANPPIKIAFVGPPVTTDPDRALNECSVLDFICRREFDFSVVEFAQGKPLSEILGISYKLNGKIVHNPDRPQIEDLDAMPWATKIYKRDMDVTRYNVPFLLHPYIALYSTRGCPAQCTFCLWPQTLSGHAWRKRSSDDVAAELKWAHENFPEVKEFFFDDDTFNIQKVRTVELCEKLKPLGITWSCTSRVTTDYDTLKAMKDAGCRLLIVGFESGDPQILKNIKKGATVERARDFARDCNKLGLTIHADFILGLPGETKESIRNTINFAKRPRLRDHPGLGRPRLPRHRVLRLRQGQRLHHQRAHGRRRRPPDGPHRISRPAHRLRHGDGAQVLRRVLLPPQGCIPRCLEGLSSTAMCPASTSKPRHSSSCAPSATGWSRKRAATRPTRKPQSRPAHNPTCAHSKADAPASAFCVYVAYRILRPNP
jgi:hopanoid biosynthesis associated radical SAM protein HpnJ